MHLLPARDLDRLFAALGARGYTCVGPTLRDEAIVCDEIAGAADLPRGWTDEQAPGRYRLKRREGEAYFGYVVGPHAWKRFLFPPQQRLWTLERRDGQFVRVDQPAPVPRHAFIGVRACDLAAIGIQDRVFTGGAFVDPGYQARRRETFIVAVQCTQAAATCFCVSMGTGPEVREGADLRLTEVVGADHYFVLEAGTDAGRDVLDELGCQPASGAHEEDARAARRRAVAMQERRLDTAGLPALLERQQESSRWAAIAERCLSCANCTLACPTCFCSTVEDTSDLTGAHADRWQRWDSCFNPGFSYIHGGEVRQGTASRYRQWLTHKLGTWVEQFGTSGCVGCGRCITWCPVGIDLTEEARRLREEDER